MLARALSGFSCPKNPDVERFLKKSAIEFTKRASRLHTLYFLWKVKNTMKRKLLRISELDENPDTYTMSAY